MRTAVFLRAANTVIKAMASEGSWSDSAWPVKMEEDWDTWDGDQPWQGDSQQGRHEDMGWAEAQGGWTPKPKPKPSSYPKPKAKPKAKLLTRGHGPLDHLNARDRREIKKWREDRRRVKELEEELNNSNHHVWAQELENEALTARVSELERHLQQLSEENNAFKTKLPELQQQFGLMLDLQQKQTAEFFNRFEEYKVGPVSPGAGAF